MGVDIHMMLVDKTGKILIEDLYDGRNSYWFNNLQKRGVSPEYEYLEIKPGLPDFMDKHLRDTYEECYYGGHYITVREYIKWYNERKPYLDAGWVTKREAWLYRTKGIEPELRYDLSKDYDVAEDMEFIEIESEWDPNTYVIEQISRYIFKNPVSDDEVYIVYYFDC